jgi:hypothetical protein
MEGLSPVGGWTMDATIVQIICFLIGLIAFDIAVGASGAMSRRR